MERTRPPSRAILDAGPMDGAVLDDEDAAEYEIMTADRARWRYVRTDIVRPDPDGVEARVYRCAGRF